MHTARTQAPSFPQFLFHFWDSVLAEGKPKVLRADAVLEALPFLGPLWVSIGCESPGAPVGEHRMLRGRWGRGSRGKAREGEMEH